MQGRLVVKPFTCSARQGTWRVVRQWVSGQAIT